MSLQFSNIDERNESFLRTLSRWIIDIALVLSLAVFVVSYMCTVYTVSGHSMEDRFEMGDHVLVDKISYKIGNPKRFDVAVFLVDGSDQTYMKRVIGLPGETVRIQNGGIYINEELLDTTGLVDEVNLPGIAEHSITLGEDEYFVIGDNSGSSEDSRFSNIGNVKKENMIGRVWFRISPAKRIGFITNKRTRS